MADRLEEIKRKRPFEFISLMASSKDLTQGDMDWLIEEIERLRGELAEANKLKMKVTFDPGESFLRFDK